MGHLSGVEDAATQSTRGLGVSRVPVGLGRKEEWGGYRGREDREVIINGHNMTVIVCVIF